MERDRGEMSRRMDVTGLRLHYAVEALERRRAPVITRSAHVCGFFGNSNKCLGYPSCVLLRASMGDDRSPRENRRTNETLEGDFPAQIDPRGSRCEARFEFS